MLRGRRPTSERHTTEVRLWRNNILDLLKK